MPVISVIDVGSNAIRMAIAAVKKKDALRVLHFCREPIRLGKDVFTNGMISSDTIERSLAAFKNFRLLTDQYHADRLRAFGTSALREASNRFEFIDQIASTSGIEVIPITGEEEARLISRTVASNIDLTNKNAILIDIGGGSVELIDLKNGRFSSSESFGMGSVRLLQLFDKQSKDITDFISLVRNYLEPMGRFIKTKFGKRKIDICLAVGGNVEVLGELRKELLGKDSNRILFTGELDRILAELQAMSCEERIDKLKLHPDRADVILPSAVVLQYLIKQLGLPRLIIPRVSLLHGILIELAEDVFGHEGYHFKDQHISSLPPIRRRFIVGEKHV